MNKTGFAMPRGRELTRQEKLRVMAMNWAITCQCGYTGPDTEFTPGHLRVGQYCCPECGIVWGKKVRHWAIAIERTGEVLTGTEVEIEIASQLELALGV